MPYEDVLKAIEKVQKRTNSKRVSMPSVDLCRRRFQRVFQPAPVDIVFYSKDGEEFLTATGTLQDYSPEGAKLACVRYNGDPVTLPSGDVRLSFEIISGDFAGIKAYGSVVRALATGTTFAIRFDSFEIKLDD